MLFIFLLFLMKIQKFLQSSNNSNRNSTLVKKNLLLGAFKKYNWNVIEPFFLSFKNARFENCECVMFVSRVSKNTISKLKSLEIIVHKIPNKFINITIINLRWKLYEDFLKDKIHKYNLVFTTDLRDSFFQLDVFKFYNSSKPFLGVAIEDGTLAEKLNKKWIVKAYGKNLHKTIKNKRIICVGTIWGTPDKFLEFSRSMWEKLSSNWSIRNKVIEQAVTNFIIYHDKMFNNCLLKSYNKDGRVMTIGITNFKDIKFDSKYNILNDKGEIAAVIHQYDRKPIISKYIRNKFHISTINTTKKKGINTIVNLTNKSSNDNFKEINILSNIIISYIIVIIITILFYSFILILSLKKVFEIYYQKLFN